MKERGIYIAIGVIIDLALSIIDRFVCKVPNYIFIPAVLIGSGFILYGFLKKEKKK